MDMDLFESKNIKPMLIGHNQAPFDSPDYVYELKLDGIRAVAYLDGSGTTLRNKRNKHINPIYPELASIHLQTNRRCILDGEILVFRDGSIDFYEVQRRALMANPFKIQLASTKLPVSFVAFDILYLDEERITHLPFTERRSLLEQTVTESPRLALSRIVEGRGIAFYNAAAAQNLEGIVAKKKDSHYYLGKTTKDWVKCKNMIHQDFVVCGYFYKGHLVSPILGAYTRDGRLIYQTHVLTGASNEDFKIMAVTAKTSKERYYSTFPDYPGAVWLEPELVCVVEYMQRTAHGGLRQPVYRGLRDDKAPEECVLH